MQIHLSDAGRNERLRGGEPRGGARIEETERVLGELNARYGGRMRGVRSDELPERAAAERAADLQVELIERERKIVERLSGG